MDAASSSHEPRSDFDLNPMMNAGEPIAVRPAAVLVGLIERKEGLSVLLTRRSDSLRSHTGQVAFPGGRIEPQVDRERKG
jgi:8-oxo-dGTP pyrophosphatase MutT (NUDIX family)